MLHRLLLDFNKYILLKIIVTSSDNLLTNDGRSQEGNLQGCLEARVQGPQGGARQESGDLARQGDARQVTQCRTHHLVGRHPK